MNNLMDFDGFKAVINLDPEIEMFRGEFINLNGGADFYATNIEDLHKEGKLSLDIFLEMCKKDGVDSKKHFSEKFNVRLSSDLHEDLVATAESKSNNQLVIDTLSESIGHRL